MNSKHSVPIWIPLANDEWHGYASETIWAESTDGQRLRVRHTPFFAKQLSLNDVISTRLHPDGYHFAGVVERGGHSTYRVIPTASSDNARVLTGLQGLEELGCSWEEGPGGLMAIDIPPTSEIEKVYAALEAGVADGSWDFEEGHVGHPLPE